MQFIDEALVEVKAGDGGRGCVAFRREKYRPNGGPSGGDGGRGGDIILVVDPSLTTLLDFRYRRSYEGKRGEHGMGSDCNGRAGTDVELRVPLGTLVLDVTDGASEQGEQIADLKTIGQRFVVAKGGLGGRGNRHFATSTNQAPRRAEPGQPGEHRKLRLELKLLADVGLVGLPNAGKSTLVARCSHARPKIANYPFTTLVPHLGVVELPGMRSFVMADIPGLIEGAAEGRGLGTRFLRHIERTRVLVHLVELDLAAIEADVAVSAEEAPAKGRKRASTKSVNSLQASKSAKPGKSARSSNLEGPIAQALAAYDTVRTELSKHDSTLLARRQIVVLTKCDLPAVAAAAPALAKAFSERQIELHLLSAATGQGLDTLLEKVWSTLSASKVTTDP